MSVALAWTCGIGGILLGLVAALIPGFPGAAVALLGVAAFAGLTGLEVVGPQALILATLIALAGSVGQLVGPVVASRAAGGTAGTATGAALGMLLGAWIPIPGAFLATALAGAVILGMAGSRKRVLGWLRGVLGASGGFAVSILADVVAVLALGAIMGVADLAHHLTVGS